MVLCLNLWASNNLSCDVSSLNLSSSSSSISFIALSKVSCDAAKWDAGNIATCSLSPNIFPVKTSNSLILSISSPKNSILIPFVEDEAGIISKNQYHFFHIEFL